MAVDFSSESPLAMQLQQVVQPKLAEFGWTTGGEDTTLFEYILLMLANDKNEAQVASELSNDLLDLGPENTETQQFAQWLFEQIEHLKQSSGGNAQVTQSIENQMDSTSTTTRQLRKIQIWKARPKDKAIFLQAPRLCATAAVPKQHVQHEAAGCSTNLTRTWTATATRCYIAYVAPAVELVV